MAGKASFGTYLKAVFLNHWNLLFLGAAVVAALIAPGTDVTLPLLGAAELAFVVTVASNPRFQRAADARAAAAETAKSAGYLTWRFNQLFYSLSSEAQQQFNQMRARCEALRPALQPDSAHGEASIDAFTSSQIGGVNKLLWVYLKLLHTRATLEKFLRTTDENEIINLEQTSRLRLEALSKDNNDPLAEKKRRSLEDTLATATTRRENLKRARDNREFVELELERIGAKLTALSELAVNRQDPALITSEVDDVARSVESTEQAIGDLQVFTGLTQEDVQAPPILNAPPQRVRA
ncbi:MAG: hypothetical protein NTW87_33470 [Planctomycetota bacterium]|nr:hypothetical protein [Planctomycetota bacterium]